MLRTALAALVLPILNLAAAHRPWHLPRQAETGTAAAAGTIATGTIPTSSAALPTGSHHENVIADVIILGGGIAGISAALTLVNMYNLSNILLLEARPELGGRAHTEYLTNEEGEQVTVEKGCNWIQGPGKEVVQDLVDKWGLKTTPTDYTDVVYFRGEWSEDEDWQTAQAQEKRGKFLSDEEVKNFTGPYDAFLEAAPEYSDNRTKASLVDLSVRVATSILDWIPTTPMEMLYEYFNIDFTYAQTPEQSSFVNAFGQEAGVANSTDSFVVDRRGYKYIFLQEAKTIFGDAFSDSRLHLNTTVRSIDYSAFASELTDTADDTSGTSIGLDKAIKVTTDQGDFYARHVISTLSVGVLQHQDVKWVPSLPPWKKEAIFSFSMATYQKIFMLFPEQFWGDTEFILRGDPDVRGRFAVWQNVNARGYFPQNTTSNVIMVTAVDALAREFENLSDNDIVEQAMVVLREMYGSSIPPPTSVVVPRWTLDPLYRGSYSNWPIGVLDQHHSNLRQPVGQDRVWFTGEAMSEEAFGYVQGAWNEGKATAQSVGSCLTAGECLGARVYPAPKTCEQEVATEQPFSAPNTQGQGRENKGGAPMRHGVPGGSLRRRSGAW